jgi:hypothetical protein
VNESHAPVVRGRPPSSSDALGRGRAVAVESRPVG